MRAMGLGLSSILILAGCSATSDQQVSDFYVQVDTDFIGTISDYKGQSVGLRWTLEGSESLDSTEEMCREFWVNMSTPAIESLYFKGHDVYFRLPFKGIQREADSSYTAAIKNSQLTYPFLELASLPAGTTTVFTLGLYEWELNENGRCFPSTNEAEGPQGGELVSEVEVTWKRPKHDKKPSPPVFDVKHENLDSTQPCSLVSDSGAHRFNSFPTEDVGTVTDSGKEENIHDPELPLDRLFGGFINVTCSDTESKISYNVKLRNSAGESENATLQFVSPKPGVTFEELDEAQKQRKISGCTETLQISEFAPSGCGLLSVEVFQFDLNTGECNFLGYWDDSSGSRRIGIFELCANDGGSVAEGSSYSLYVRNNGPTDYSNALGTTNRVLYFTVLASK